MAITIDDFDKIWASTSPLTPYEFSESNYKEGWNFIGGTPPSRQMWDFLQKNNDEKMQYLADNYLPLSGGTVTGDLAVTGDLSVGGTVTGDLVYVKSGSNTAVNTLQRETAYNVGDIVYTSALNAKYYLLCVTAGTTASMLPSFSGATSDTHITDGTVVWRVQTVTSQEAVSAINTRLGTILTASGSFTAGGSVTDICSITTHPAGTYLIVGYTSNSASATSTFANYIYAGVMSLGSCVSTGDGGGGCNNVKIVMLAENEVVTLKGFKASGVGGTFSGTLMMVQLA